MSCLVNGREVRECARHEDPRVRHLLLDIVDPLGRDHILLGHDLGPQMPYEQFLDRRLIHARAHAQATIAERPTEPEQSLVQLPTDSPLTNTRIHEELGYVEAVAVFVGDEGAHVRLAQDAEAEGPRDHLVVLFNHEHDGVRPRTHFDELLAKLIRVEALEPGRLREALLVESEYTIEIANRVEESGLHFFVLPSSIGGRPRPDCSQNENTTYRYSSNDVRLSL